MLDNGEIVEIGSYDELRMKNGVFAEFIKIFLEASSSQMTKNNSSSLETISLILKLEKTKRRE